MRMIWAVLVLAGCSATPHVDWPSAFGGPAPDLLPIDAVLGPDTGAPDARGAALDARAAALKARVAVQP